MLRPASQLGRARPVGRPAARCLALVAALALAAGCSGPEEEPASPWCERARAMVDAGAAVAAADPAEPAGLERAYRAAEDTVRAAQPGAPTEVADDLATLRDGTERLVDVLARHGWDPEAAAGDPEFAAVRDDPDYTRSDALVADAVARQCPPGPSAPPASAAPTATTSAT
ncbi:MAG: hypothetical protein IPM45_00645 [Acidimicrobiales bacterium]|nr:hypothetical protein [Acidimicrobiales bacterium]